jgi:hypothetical protein
MVSLVARQLLNRSDAGRTMSRIAAHAVALLLAVGCAGESNSAGAEAFRQLPHYPGAVQTESIAQSGMLGILSGEIVQLTTGDSFDEVLDFYRTALADQDVEVIDHTSDLGRQTAISMRGDNHVVTVAIQEFVDEGAVNVTLMRVGS